MYKSWYAGMWIETYLSYIEVFVRWSEMEIEQKLNII